MWWWWWWKLGCKKLRAIHKLLSQTKPLQSSSLTVAWYLSRSQIQKCLSTSWPEISFTVSARSAVFGQSLCGMVTDQKTLSDLWPNQEWEAFKILFLSCLFRWMHPELTDFFCGFCMCCWAYPYSPLCVHALLAQGTLIFCLTSGCSLFVDKRSFFFVRVYKSVEKCEKWCGPWLFAGRNFIFGSFYLMIYLYVIVCCFPDCAHISILKLHEWNVYSESQIILNYHNLLNLHWFFMCSQTTISRKCTVCSPPQIHTDVALVMFYI